MPLRIHNIFSQIASLRPPFLGDSFPALKRAVVLGRYSPIPNVYSESLSRVINSLLRVNPRERPTSAQVLAMPELQDKILSFQALQRARPDADNLLLNTIKVPQALRKLNDVLPKPCYPEAISPRAPPPAPAALSNDELSCKENVVNVASEVSPRSIAVPRNPHPPQRPLIANNPPHRIQFSNYAR